MSAVPSWLGSNTAALSLLTRPRWSRDPHSLKNGGRRDRCRLLAESRQDSQCRATGLDKISTFRDDEVLDRDVVALPAVGQGSNVSRRSGLGADRESDHA